MKLGIGSFTYGWGVGAPDYMPAQPLTAMELLERTKEFGLHVCQICNNMPIDAFTDGELKAVKAKADEYEIDLEIGTAGLRDEVIARYLHMAEILNAKIMRMVIDAPGYDPGEAQIVSIIKNWMPQFEKQGVRLGIENHDRYPSRILARIFAAVDSEYCGMCLDTANSISALEDSDTLLAYLAPYTVNLHLKDVYIQRLWSKQGFTVVGAPAGKGVLDIPHIVKIIAGNGRDANWIIEQWTGYEKDLDTTIKKEMDEAAQAVAYLKELIQLYQ